MSKIKDMARRIGGALGVTHQEPEVAIQQPPALEERGESPAHFWPAGQPLPTCWPKRQRLLPCPNCRRVQLKDGGQAAACQRSGADVAFFRCRACGHTWKLAVR